MMKKSSETKNTSSPNVDNGAPIRRLASRMIRKNRGKNLVILLSVALCTFLFTALFTVGGILLDKLEESTTRQVGSNSMGSFKYLNEEEYRKIASDPKVEDVSGWVYLGEVRNPEMAKLRTEIHRVDAKSARKNFCVPEVGRLPESEDEAVTSDLVLTALGIEPKLGEKISLDLEAGEKKLTKTFTLSGIYKGDRIAMSQLVLVSESFQRKFAPTPIDSYYEKGAFRTFEDGLGRIVAEVDFRFPFRIREQLQELAERQGLPADIEVGVNWGKTSGMLDASALVLFGFLLLTIFLSGYLIINNVYRIHVYADIRSYGLLKTIGMSGRQLARLIRHQARILSVPGILAGIVTGVLVGVRILPSIMELFTFAESVGTEATIRPWILVCSALFSYGTVQFSCRKPARIASKVSPIEASKYTEKTTQTKKRRGTEHRAGGSFCTRFVRHNLSRDKKKVSLVVLSLTLSLLLLNTVYGILDGFDEEKYIARQALTDFSVADATLDNASIFENKNTAGVSPKFLKELRSFPGTEEIGNIYLEAYSLQEFNDENFRNMKERLFDHPLLAEVLNDPVSPDGNETTRSFYEREKIAPVDIYGMDPSVLEHLPIRSGNFDSEKFQTGKYLLVNEYEPESDSETSIAYFRPGEQVSVSNSNGETETYEVMATVKLPFPIRLQLFTELNLAYVLPTEEFISFLGERDPMRTVFNVSEEYEQDVEQWLSDYTSKTDPSLTYRSKEIYRKSFQSLTGMIAVIGGLLTGILALIGLLNLANTIATSILSRRTELAMLEAVGLTRKMQIRTLCLEGLSHILLSAVVTIPIASLFSALLLRNLEGVIWFFSWRFSLFPIFVILPVMLLLAGLFPVLFYRFAVNGSVVERLRSSER